MKTLIAPALIALVMAFPSHAQVRTPIELPADPSAAVIVFEDRGYIGWVFRRNYNPVLTVRADGSVTAVDPLGDANGFQGKLSPSELQDLLRFAIEEQDFFSFTPSGIFEPVPPEIECIFIGNSHYKSTYIRIQTRDRQHEALADQGRGGIPIERFEILEKRLRRLAEMVKSGAKDRIPEALGRANEFLMRTHRELRPLSVEEFSAVSPNASGTRDFVFRHEERDGSWFQVIVPESPARQVQPVFQNGIEPKRTYPNAKDLLAYLYDHGLISDFREAVCDGTSLKLPN